jgi:uncharacterized protein (TIGR03435 family)
MILLAPFLTLSLGIAKAQSGTQANPPIESKAGELEERSFAVTSVRPSLSKELGFRLRTPPGRLTAVGITPKELVEYAYDLKPFQVHGGDGWTNEDKFDIDAVTDESTAAFEAKERDFNKRADKMRLMAQDLLLKRFGLVAHLENTLGSVYELSLAKPMTDANHPGLRPFVPGTSGQSSGAGSPGAYNVIMTNVPIHALALRISDYLESPVVDKTNLSGTFDISLSWDDTLGDAPSMAGGTVSLPESLQTELDLRLVRTKAPIEILVIDKLDHPSAN